RGIRLYRTRNINAPLPDSGIRPNPRFININQFESTGLSRSNSLRITLQMEAFDRLELVSQYTLSRTKDNTGGLFSLPADNYDLRSEYGRADFDRLHQFDVLALLRLPHRIKLAAIAYVASGIPLDITTGFDANGDTVAKDRPPGITRNT